MSKEKSAKKEKKEKKRSDVDGVKKAKKDKKKEVAAHVAEAAAEAVEAIGSPAPVEKIEILKGPMVPFANPLADDKATKKILKAVRKCKCYRRFEAARMFPSADIG
jgi:H/ACA ribonucleoprotein complex subunit 2